MVVFQEIDYTKEAFNAEKFAENFKNMDYVKVPEIYWEYTTPQVPSIQKLVHRLSSNIEQKIKLKFILYALQVLTMEYVPGIKINRIQQIDKLGLDRKRYPLKSEYYSAMTFFAVPTNIGIFCCQP